MKPSSIVQNLDVHQIPHSFLDTAPEKEDTGTGHITLLDRASG